MFASKKSLLGVVALFSTAFAVLLSPTGDVMAFKDEGVSCVVDVVVETRNQAGTVVGREAYQKEFVLEEGGQLFDDFSTRTRFKFFTATFNRNDGETTIAIDWFADVTVFNSVDFSTAVVLSDGQKSGKSIGQHTLYTSGGSTTTRYSLSCVEN